MNYFRIWNICLGWLSFSIAASVYFLTIEPSVSWWDCGEFIACAYKLEIGHPPGAPLFLLIGRVFSLFAGNPEKVAIAINSISALTSAFTVMFLFWTITHIVKKVYNKEKYSPSEMIIILGSGLTGALALTFSDTFWFSSVEAEVYSASSLFTAMVFWAILKWENVADKPYSNRWIIFIAYLMGLSIGIHLLNLLAIPAIVMVYYFRKYDVTYKGIIKALGLSLLILAFIMYGIINGLVKIAAAIELFFVNDLGFPFNSGTVFFTVSVISLVCFGIWFTHKKRKILWNTIILCVTVILIGYSSYAIIPIRSHANPPLDENNPENIFSLMSYLNREQYGERPLLFGHYYNDQIKRDNSGYVIMKEGKPVYMKDTVDNSYKVACRKTKITYSGSLKFFPRMYSRDPEHIKEYQAWGAIRDNRINFANNFLYFLNYQLGHMYFRYFMWNFCGRQNDVQSYGSLINGNWFSGIKLIDEWRLGDQNKLPDKYKNNPSRNIYYMLPLLFGILGMFYHSSRKNKDFWIIMLLFIMTGIAIVIYLNQTPLQPRERDYAYAGSFYAFCIWIGLGVTSIFEFIKKKWQNILSALLTIAFSILLIPVFMASVNWDDHDRSGRYTVRDIAKNYLTGCEKNAIIFTVGDNDTFPLWYIQEVEGFRTDIRIVNLMLLNTEWYIDQIGMKTYESDPLPVSLPKKKYSEGVNNYIYLRDDPDTMKLTALIEKLKADHPSTKEKIRIDKMIDILPTANLILDVDTIKVISNGTVNPKDADLIESPMIWTLEDNPISKANLIQLDILANNNWKRPIYSTTGGYDSNLSLESYFQLEGLVNRLVPIRSKKGDKFLWSGRIDTDVLYSNLMEKYKWGGINKPGVKLDHYSMRVFSTIRFRDLFIRLAEELINEGKIERAVEVLDRCMKLAPDKILPFDEFISGITYSIGKDKKTIHYPGIVELYYKCNEFDKGNTLLLEYFKILKQDIVNYSSLREFHKIRFEYEMQQSRALINELLLLLKKYDQEEIIKLDVL